MAAPRRQTIKYPKGKAFGKVIAQTKEKNGKVVVEYELKNSKWFERFWRANRDTLIEQATYYTEGKVKKRNVKKLFRQELAERIAKGNLGEKGRKHDVGDIKRAVRVSLRTRTWGGKHEVGIENLQNGIKYFGLKDGSKKTSNEWKALQSIGKKHNGVLWDTLQDLGHDAFSIELGDGDLVIIRMDESPKEITFSIREKQNK